MQVGFLGHGVFGAAIGSLVEANGHTPEYVDLGGTFSSKPTVLFLAVPVQHLRSALTQHLEMLDQVSLVVNLTKGIEKESGHLPHQIVASVLPDRSYVAVAGPSFASEIMAKVPTTVSVTGTESEAVGIVRELLTQPYFVLEELGTIREIELAAAMKNIYAVASGYIAGSGGGKNTHAHVQVVALREYTKLIHAMAENADVVRPGVVGDLVLTCGSSESRNYQYGFALGSKGVPSEETAEGASAAEAVAVITAEYELTLPLATAVSSLVTGDTDAYTLMYTAIGFDALK